MTTLAIPVIRRKAKIYPCPHLHTTITTTGSIRFYGGDIEDTTVDHLVCVDCGQTLDDPQPAREQNFIGIVEMLQ